MSEEVGRPTRMVRRYGAKVIAIHWLFIITIFPLLVTGLLLLRDWFFEEFHIIGVDELVPTFEGAAEYHGYFGLAVLAIGLVHILLHIGQKEKPILLKNVSKEWKATVHNIMYIFHMASRDERGAGEKWKANQRMAYASTVYLIALSGLTALFVYMDLLGELSMVLHVLAGVLFLLLSGYRILHLVRNHSGVAWKCVLATGKMPEWYVRKQHFLWYRELRRAERERASEGAEPSGSTKGETPEGVKT